MPGFSSSSSSSSSIHLSTHFSRKRGEESMPPQPEPSKANSSSPASNGSARKEHKKVAVRYAQCRKNHAASIGGYAVDGCREFMASGEAGTAAALLCAACTCHRSFHKREVEFDPPPPLSGSSSTSSSDSQVDN